MQQWVDEMRLHAPSLNVLIYDGWKKLPAHVQHATQNFTYSSNKENKLVPKKGKKKAVEEGRMDVEEEVGEPVDWATYVNSFDVCITTYNVLQQDLNVARAPPKRSRRESADYSRTTRVRSPLVCVEFFRVIMDEVGHCACYSLDTSLTVVFTGANGRRRAHTVWSSWRS
jgi:E3 ubiquitin-protein ligase SHPRH